MMGGCRGRGGGMQLRLSPTNFALLFTIAIPVAASFGIGRVSVLGASSADLQLRRSGTLSVCHTGIIPRLQAAEQAATRKRRLTIVLVRERFAGLHTCVQETRMSCTVLVLAKNGENGCKPMVAHSFDTAGGCDFRLVKVLLAMPYACARVRVCVRHPCVWQSRYLPAHIRQRASARSSTTTKTPSRAFLAACEAPSRNMISLDTETQRRSPWATFLKSSRHFHTLRLPAAFATRKAS